MNFPSLFQWHCSIDLVIRITRSNWRSTKCNRMKRRRKNCEKKQKNAMVCDGEEEEEIERMENMSINEMCSRAITKKITAARSPFKYLPR